MTIYRHILSEALKTTWHYKYLWFFGLFAALLGNSGELEVIFRGFSGAPNPGLFPGLSNLGETGIFSTGIFNNIANLSRSDPFTLFLMLGVFLIVVGISVFLVWLAVVSQAALVNNVAREKADKTHDFKEGMHEGVKKFWPVFGLNVLYRLVLYVAFFLLSVPIITSINQGSGAAINILYIISFVVFVPLGIIFSFITKYAIAFIVVKKEKFMSAIRLGWQLFEKNWLISIEMAFLLFAISFLVGIAAVLILLVLTIPFLFIGILLSSVGFYFNMYAIMVSALILYVGFIAILGAMLSTFQVSAWTNLFIELVSRGGVSKLVRFINKE